MSTRGELYLGAYRPTSLPRETPSMFYVLRRLSFGISLVAVLFPAAAPAQEATPAAGDATTPADAATAPTDAATASAGVSPLSTLDPASLPAVLEKLSSESRKQFGEMLANDWQDRPEWSDMLIDLLKADEMQPGFGWFKPSERKYDWSWLSAGFDTNADGFVAQEELPVDTLYPELLFSRLDRDNDGELRLADFDYFGRQQPTPPQLMSQFLSSLLDVDSNGRITPEELQAFLARADQENAGFLTAEDLYGRFSREFFNRSEGDDDMPGPEKMLSMFFRGELGVFESGPRVGEEAPDFTLPTHDGSRTITLSQSRGRPVVLIFGSFT